MAIPIQNIYYLLVYAWDKLPESKIVNINADECQEYAELFARVLINGCGLLFKRGLDRDYIGLQENYVGIKGKMLMAETIKANTLIRSQTVCGYDDFSYDILQNQILKFTISRLLKVKALPRDLKKQLKSLFLRFHNVSMKDVRPQDFKRVKIHRNNAFYAFLLNVCYLIYDSLLPSEQTGEIKFKDFTRDEKKMAHLFEEFVRNFYKRKIHGFKVKRENIEWFLRPVDEKSDGLLPKMETDISLDSIDRKIIIDCKFYNETLTEHFGKTSIRSGHLNQIYAYMSNYKINEMYDRPIEGILLYPVTTNDFHASFEYLGFNLKIHTINLNQPWRQIEEDLLEMITPLN